MKTLVIVLSFFVVGMGVAEMVLSFLGKQSDRATFRNTIIILMSALALLLFCCCTKDATIAEEPVSASNIEATPGRTTWEVSWEEDWQRGE